MRQLHDGRDIDVELRLEHLVVGRPEFARRPESGVVHQDLDTGAEAVGDRGPVGGVGEVGAQHIDVGTGLGAQLRCQALEPVGVARDQDQVVAVHCVTAGETLTEPGRRSGDQGDGA
jgi:hypothetical protein